MNIIFLDDLTKEKIRREVNGMNKLNRKRREKVKR
jgi:hypothetical protein